MKLSHVGFWGSHRDVFHAAHVLCYDDCGLAEVLSLDLRQRHHSHPALSLRLAHHLLAAKTVRTIERFQA